MPIIDSKLKEFLLQRIIWMQKGAAGLRFTPMEQVGMQNVTIKSATKI